MEPLVGRRGQSSTSPTPRTRVWRIGPEFPTPAVKWLNRQGPRIYALETPNVHDVIFRVRSRPKKWCDPAVPTKVMLRGHRTEPVGREIVCSRQKSKILGCHHVVQISFLSTDRTVALARASEVSSDLKTDSPAVTAPYVASPFHDASLMCARL
jgi:hypothetical protein